MATTGRPSLTDPATVFLTAAVAVMIAGFLAVEQEETPQPAPWRAEVQATLASLESRSGRPPTATEEAALREVVIDVEALVREARALGLGRDDHIVRGRLAQKRRAVARRSTHPTDDGGPADAEIGPSVTRFSFEHVFFSRHHGADEVARRLDAARRRLDAGDEAASLGEPFIRGRAFSALDAGAADRIFGPGFVDRLDRVETGNWSRVESSYGTHLVRLDARTSSAPARRAARDARVATDTQGRQAEGALLEALRIRYPIVREDAIQERR